MSRMIGIYSVQRMLKSDSKEKVFLATARIQAAEPVVVKLLTALRLNTVEGREDFRQEAAFLTELRHPNIVALHNAGMEGNTPYVVTSYAAAGSLRNRLRSSSRLTLADALRTIKQIGAGLQYAHERNILHCAIRPENVLFLAEDHAALADFSLVSLQQDINMRIFGQKHAARYMAPEQFAGVMSKEGDLYALACVAYELLTGHPPFEARNLPELRKKHELEKPRPLRSLVPTLPLALERAVLRALMKDPAERYADVAAFLQALDDRGVEQDNVPEVEKAVSPVLTTVQEDLPGRLSKAKETNVLAYSGTPRASRMHLPILHKRSVFSLAVVGLVVLFIMYSLFLLLPQVTKRANLPQVPQNTPDIPIITWPSPKPTLGASPVSPTAGSGTHIRATPTPEKTAPFVRVATVAPTPSPTATSLPTPLPTATPTKQVSNDPLLSGSFAANAGDIDLSHDGSTDWVHWGLSDANSLDRKAGVTQQITNFYVIGSIPLRQYSDNPATYTWYDGLPITSASNTPTGIFVSGRNDGFSITVVPPDTNVHTLRVYVGVYSGQGNFVATLNNSKISTIVDTSLNSARQSTSIGVYVLSFRGNNASQTLSVSYTLLNEYDNEANVTLQAATLS